MNLKQDQLEETLIEEALIKADIGLETIDFILEKIKKTPQKTALEQVLQHMLLPPVCVDFNAEKPTVILLCGVNGSGKTTTAGKLAWKAQQAQKTCILAAGDTFRAGAADQLNQWAQRTQATLVGGAGAHKDPAAVIYQALTLAAEQTTDITILDTAGRLQNQQNLMAELGKINTIMAQKTAADATVLRYLVIDAVTGQNALQQAQLFQQALQQTGPGLNGVIVTKLDASSRGGVIFSLAHLHRLPVCYVGNGETLDALQPFEPESILAAFLEKLQ